MQRALMSSRAHRFGKAALFISIPAAVPRIRRVRGSARAGIAKFRDFKPLIARKGGVARDERKRSPTLVIPRPWNKCQAIIILSGVKNLCEQVKRRTLES